MKKILIIKTSSLGDIIHAYPAIDYLRNKFPLAQIDWIVEKPFAQLVSTHPFIANTITIHTSQWRKGFYYKKTIRELLDFRRELRKEVYDVVFDLQGNSKSGFVLSQVRSPSKVGFGRNSVSEWPNLLFTTQRYDPPLHQNVRDESLFLVKSFFNDFTDCSEQKVRLNISERELENIHLLLRTPNIQKGPKILVCPGSAWPNKQLHPDSLLTFLTLLDLELKGSFLFLWGSEHEKKFAEILHTKFANNSLVVDRLSLPSLQNLMGSVDLVIAMDSLPLHLAGTTNTPTFSVFGASSANKYNPKGKNNIAFQGECPYGRSFERRCPVLRTCSTGTCIRGVQGKELFDYFMRTATFRG